MRNDFEHEPRSGRSISVWTAENIDDEAIVHQELKIYSIPRYSRLFRCVRDCLARESSESEEI